MTRHSLQRLRKAGSCRKPHNPFLIEIRVKKAGNTRLLFSLLTMLERLSIMQSLGGCVMNRLNIEDRARILNCLVEGNSMRATSRMVDVSINTVTKLLVDVGAACSTYQHQTLKNLPCKRIQCDE